MTGGLREQTTATTTPSPARRWHFASAVLDELSLDLMVDGVEAEIERKPLEVLLHLLRHAGEVVTKEELLVAVWPGRILSDTVLAKAIGRVREVLKDSDQVLIKTVYGYGYRLMVPVRIELQRAPEPAHFNFSAGDHPPGRPLWSLMHRLGAGGHGEAWLGQHDKTREQRVFKFAIDEPSLTALKREITLFRFLKDSLGDHARVLPLIDWNLETPPCFVESGYIAGGSLVDWAEHSGGLGKIPLDMRIEIAAQIAEALAAVHSVGVLHKDLKPSNLLIDTASGPTPKVLLADFGSGGVLDPRQLEELGITRMGFTKTVLAIGPSSGTPLYLAPELLAGQPPTVKADVYALGIVLYQLVVGEFRKGLTSGWEHEVADELLREIIADATQGDPARRLGDAGQLAQRLRRLEQDRIERRAERDAQAKAEALTRALERMRARRMGLIAAGAALVLGLVVSLVLYADARSARHQAERDAARAQAVADFLSHDMFATVSSKPLRDLTVQELLEAASETLTQKMEGQPEAAAQLHLALGNAFWKMERPKEAESHLDRAMALFLKQGAHVSSPVLSAIAQVIVYKASLGKLAANLSDYESLRVTSETQLRADDPGLLQLSLQIGIGHFLLGNWIRSVEELRRVVVDSKDGATQGLAQLHLGRSLYYLGRYRESADVLQEAQRHLASAASSSIDAATAHMWLGRSFIDLGRFDEAEAELSQAALDFQPWVRGDDSVHLASVKFYSGQLRYRQGKISEAVELLDAAVKTLSSLEWMKVADHTYEFRAWLAQALAGAGRLDEAEQSMRQALDSSAKTLGAGHPISQDIRIKLAGIVLRRSGPSAAREIIDGVDVEALERLGAESPLIRELRRVEALIDKGADRVNRSEVRSISHELQQ